MLPFDSLRAPIRVAGAAVLATALLATGVPLVAQIQIRARAPVANPGTLVDPDGSRGPNQFGRAPQMLESPNIDRFLRRAQDRLAQEDYPTAIGLLQDVIEGRTLEEPTAAAPAGEGPGDAETVASPIDDLGQDARHAVFSQDDRLYRPVERLCHELLAGLPGPGLAYYRAEFEVAAERALEAAIAESNIAALHEVERRFFATVAAGRAMHLAGDAELDRGSPREAIRTYRQLLEIYPGQLLEPAGVDRTWLRFKIALCCHLLGDEELARAELSAAADEEPDATLRVAGELVSLQRLGERGFATATGDADPPDPAGEDESDDDSLQRSLASGEPRADLIPLWEYRFADEHPYRPAKVSGDGRQRFVVRQGDGMAPTPKYSEYVSGPRLTLLDHRVAFLDHRRLVVLDTLTGRATAVGDGEVDLDDPQPGRPRLRIPSYDFATQRVVPLPAEGWFCVMTGPRSRRPEQMQAVLSNGLEVLAADGAARWRSGELPELADTTFLAAPTPFGERLLVPVLRRGTIELLCLDTASGSAVYRTPLHRDGTEFARPPAVPVRVEDGVAYVQTNAGCLAAVAAHTGALRWVRRYERLHPFRDVIPRRRQSAQDAFGGSYFREQRLPGFAPSDLILHDGLLVIAPCDGRAMLGIDAMSGELVWALSLRDMVVPIGHDGDALFVIAADELLCIGLHSGLRRWATAIPPHPGSSSWRGRGTVFHRLVLIPGDREIHVLPTTGGTWRSYPMPTLRLGAEPLQGPMDLFATGSLVMAAFEGGVQAFSTSDALHERAAELAATPARESVWLALAGDLLGAIAALERVTEPTAAVQDRLLTLCSELALAMASHGERDGALQLLDRAAAKLSGELRLQRWHLARIEVFETLGDFAAVAAEQVLLYERMDRAPAPTNARPNDGEENDR